MKLSILVSIMCVSLMSQAAIHEKIQLSQRSAVWAEKIIDGAGTFKSLQIANLESSRQVGRAALPIKSWLVIGKPEQVSVKTRINSSVHFEGVQIAPTEPQDCRCDVAKKAFTFNRGEYEKKIEPTNVEYLGAFRGQDISRVDVLLANYEPGSQKLDLHQEMEVEISADAFTLPRVDYKDYLILVPSQLEPGIRDFVQYKKNQGYNVLVEILSTPQLALNLVSQLIRQHYTNDGTDFVMFIGDESAIPMYKVETTGSYSTPSDLPYLTLDGAKDSVPDVFASRITASTASAVQQQLKKAIDFEQQNYASAVGLKKVIGIASNEGSKPSDKEYIISINKEFEGGLNAETTLIHQDDALNSNPKVLNEKFNIGARWLTYIGHGSGMSWPSMATSYSTANIKQVSNEPSVKPIILDVACQNGRLIKGQLGTSFMEVGSETDFGASAYYGGTVNISWHPPAVMAQGIAHEQMSNNYKHLGEALLAGHLYLASKWNDLESVVDNLEWYHLQGDPGMRINF